MKRWCWWWCDKKEFSFFCHHHRHHHHHLHHHFSLFRMDPLMVTFPIGFGPIFTIYLLFNHLIYCYRLFVFKKFVLRYANGETERQRHSLMKTFLLNYRFHFCVLNSCNFIVLFASSSFFFLSSSLFFYIFFLFFFHFYFRLVARTDSENYLSLAMWNMQNLCKIDNYLNVNVRILLSFFLVRFKKKSQKLSTSFSVHWLR